MSNVTWPTLSMEGWIIDPTRMLNMSFAHTLASGSIQTNVYRGNITSMTDLIVRYQNDPATLAQEIERAYSKLYQRLFDSASVNVSYTPNKDSTYVINLSIIVESNGVNYSLAHTMTLDTGPLQNTLKGLTRYE